MQKLEVHDVDVGHVIEASASFVAGSCSLVRTSVCERSDNDRVVGWMIVCPTHDYNRESGHLEKTSSCLVRDGKRIVVGAL